jgi:two-component system, cell cycle response regulator
MKVLIVEDEVVSKRLLEVFLLRLGYEVVSVSSGKEALAVLLDPGAPSLVISDWMMPEIDGLELCHRTREIQTAGYIYFIILTSKMEKKDIIKGLEAGADDYLIKPFDQEELKCRLKIGERILNLERRILELANMDSLTGVFNRRAFMERFQIEIHRCNRECVPLSLILADIDHFKRVNDLYGHQVGDMVLQKFAERLSASTRPYDLVARYGGEEFVVCLPGIGCQKAGSVAERMRRLVEANHLTVPTTAECFSITASFGVASLRNGSEECPEPLIGRADCVMYKAKHEGRNRVCLAIEDCTMSSETQKPR